MELLRYSTAKAFFPTPSHLAVVACEDAVIVATRDLCYSKPPQTSNGLGRRLACGVTVPKLSPIVVPERNYLPII